MTDIIQILAFILPIIATLCVLSVVCVTTYLKIRRKLPIKVNCWFCNAWSKVKYDDYNSFYCPKCLQYNGFNEHGDYNRVLLEQHDELLNQQVPLIQRHNEFSSSNGLCHICNNNQKLKIYQLANFVPLNEDSYDVEVEHFQKQLEKAYKLCKRCDKVVRNVISKQNSWLLLGKKINGLKNRGVSLLDLNQPTNSLSTESKHSFFQTFLKIMLILFASLITVFAISNMNYTLEKIDEQTLNYMRPYTLPILRSFNSSKLAVANVFHKYLNISDCLGSSNLVLEYFANSNVTAFRNLAKNINTPVLEYMQSFRRSDIYLLAIVGLFLQTTSMLFSKISYQSSKLIVLWCSLLALIWYQHALPHQVFCLIQIFISICILYTLPSRKIHTKQNENVKLKSKKKTAKTKPSDEDILCDKDDFMSDYSLPEEESLFNSTLKLHNFETDTAISDCSFSTITSRTLQKPRLASPLASNHAEYVFGTPPTFASHLSQSPLSINKINTQYSAFTRSDKSNSFNTSFKGLNNYSTFKQSPEKCNKSFCTDYNFDLNESLHNLSLGKTDMYVDCSKQIPIKVLKNNLYRPILSPPKFKCTSHNLWLSSEDNSFWKNVKDITSESANISSSSSQSSGFASQNNDFPDHQKVTSRFMQKRNLVANSNNLERRLHRQNFLTPRSAQLRSNNRDVLELDRVFQPIQANSKKFDDIYGNT